MFDIRMADIWVLNDYSILFPKSHTNAQNSVINMHCAMFAYNTFSNQFTIREPCIFLGKEVNAKRHRNINPDLQNNFVLNESNLHSKKWNLHMMSFAALA